MKPSSIYENFNFLVLDTSLICLGYGDECYKSPNMYLSSIRVFVSDTNMAP